MKWIKKGKGTKVGIRSCPLYVVVCTWLFDPCKLFVDPGPLMPNPGVIIGYNPNCQAYY